MPGIIGCTGWDRPGRLDLGLLIHAQHHGALGRVVVQPRADLCREIPDNRGGRLASTSTGTGFTGDGKGGAGASSTRRRRRAPRRGELALTRSGSVACFPSGWA